MSNVEVRIGLNDMLRLKKKSEKIETIEKRTFVQEAMRL